MYVNFVLYFHIPLLYILVHCSLFTHQPAATTQHNIHIFVFVLYCMFVVYIYNFERLSAYLAISFTFSISILYLILLGIRMFLNLFSLNVNLRLCACVCVLCIFGLYFGSVCISYVDVGFSVFLRVLCFLCDSYTYILPFAGSEFVFSFSVYFFLILLCKAAPA